MPDNILKNDTAPGQRPATFTESAFDSGADPCGVILALAPLGARLERVRLRRVEAKLNSAVHIL